MCPAPCTFIVLGAVFCDDGALCVMAGAECLMAGTVVQELRPGHIDGFVPQKRFMLYQLPRLDGFVPQKRFNRDKRHYFEAIEEMSLKLHSNIKHQPSPSGARLIIYNMLIIKTKQTFSTTIRN